MAIIGIYASSPRRDPPEHRVDGRGRCVGGQGQPPPPGWDLLPLGHNHGASGDPRRLRCSCRRNPAPRVNAQSPARTRARSSLLPRRCLTPIASLPKRRGGPTESKRSATRRSWRRRPLTSQKEDEARVQQAREVLEDSRRQYRAEREEVARILAEDEKRARGRGRGSGTTARAIRDRPASEREVSSAVWIQIRAVPRSHRRRARAEVLLPLPSAAAPRCREAGPRRTAPPFSSNLERPVSAGAPEGSGGSPLRGPGAGDRLRGLRSAPVTFALCGLI